MSVGAQLTSLGFLAAIPLLYYSYSDSSFLYQALPSWYLSGKHIPLFMFALLVLLFLLHCNSAFCPLSSRKGIFAWIESQRLKLLTCSNYAPLKYKYRPWIGLLLVLRLCLLLVFVSNSLGDNCPCNNIYCYLCSVLEITLWNYLHQLVLWCTWTFLYCKTWFIFPVHFKTNVNQKDLAFISSYSNKSISRLEKVDIH